MPLTTQRLDADVSVAAQLDPAVMADVAAAGFRSVVNNRPDFEGGPTQPTSASIEQAARAAGLEYVHQPVASQLQTDEDIARFADLLASLPHPVLAFCRSGTRSARLAQAAKAL